MIASESIPVNTLPHKYLIQKEKNSYSSWDLWLREVVWYGNKRGAYLHGSGNDPIKISAGIEQIEGHY